MLSQPSWHHCDTAEEEMLLLVVVVVLSDSEWVSVEYSIDILLYI